MNAITKSAKGITSITLTEFIEAGGELTKLETISMGNGPDSDVHVFTVENHDGTYTSDNACVSWIDARFEAVVAALKAGDVSDLPESKAISSIEVPIRIETNQGVSAEGQVFGYDHGRHNFVNWALASGKIVVASVEHDSEEDSHGSLTATERAARSIAARENSLPNSQLKVAIMRARLGKVTRGGITPKMIQEYEAGTLSGWLAETGQGLWFEQLAERLAQQIGKRVIQKQRGVIIWQ